jgi:hypothetical protein
MVQNRKSDPLTLYMFMVGLFESKRLSKKAEIVLAEVAVKLLELAVHGEVELAQALEAKITLGLPVGQVRSGEDSCRDILKRGT